MRASKEVIYGLAIALHELSSTLNTSFYNNQKDLIELGEVFEILNVKS